MRNLKYVLLATGLALAGCATSQTGQVAELQGLYIAGVSAEILYENSGTANPAILKTVEADRVTAYAALQPLETAAENGTSVLTAAELEAATAAIAAFQNFEAANSIKGAS